MNIYTIHCLSEAMSPITHMDRAEGNESLIARQDIMTSTGKRAIPKLSGNALRHRMLREPLARHLVETCGLAGRLTMRQLNFLFHGGSLTESSARQDTAGWGRARELLPMLRLLGGCLPDAILPGSLTVDAGWLVCRENTETLRYRSPSPDSVPTNLRPAESFVSGYQYTRSDAAKSAADLADGQSKDDGSLMIFAGQSIVPGACFVHDLIANHVSELELGAIVLALSIWQASGGIIGGQSSRGHGRFRTRVVMPDGVDAAALMAAYHSHVLARAADVSQWLADAFAPKPEKTKGKKKKGGGDAAPEGDSDAE